ncbi:MAG: hypothetical protein IPP83_15755 [Flavobacteriales bacterium]|nr:hypothetical protein [Flavobacteriales bacterium]
MKLGVVGHAKVITETEVGKVNTSEATYELVRNETDLTFTPRGKVKAKGKGEMYFAERG